MNLNQRITARILIATLAGAVVTEAAEEGFLTKILGKESAAVWTEEELDTSLSVEDFVGRKVVDGEGRRLGKIADLTLHDHHGQFEFAVLEVGGLLDWNKALIAIPYDRLEHRPGTQSLIWDVPREEFQALVDQSKEKRHHAASSQHPSPQSQLTGSTKEDRSNTSAGRSADLESTNASDPLVEKAMAAIAEDDKLASSDRDITIQRAEDGLVVRGRVKSPQIKNHILMVVEKATGTEVVDAMVVN